MFTLFITLLVIQLYHENRLFYLTCHSNLYYYWKLGLISNSLKLDAKPRPGNSPKALLFMYYIYE